MDVNYMELTDRMKAVGELNLVFKLAGIYGLSMDWLLTGEGKPYKDGCGYKIEDPMAIAARSLLREKLKSITAYASLYAPLNADEIIAVGKLLKVIRSDDPALVGLVNTVLATVYDKLEKEG